MTSFYVHGNEALRVRGIDDECLADMLRYDEAYVLADEGDTLLIAGRKFAVERWQSMAYRVEWVQLAPLSLHPEDARLLV